MYDHDALTIRQIGGDFIYQTILMADSEPVWVSPTYLDRESAEATAAELADAIKYGVCTHCQQNPYKLTEVLGDGELVFICQDCHSDAMVEL